MGFLKTLFGGDVPTPEEKKKADDNKQFDMFKYDGARAAAIGQTDYAVKCFREALAIRQDDEVSNWLAHALVRSGELDEAQKLLETMAEAKPDNAETQMLLAAVAYMTEDYGLMNRAAQRALELDPDNPRPHLLHAQALIGQKEMVVAVAELSKAIALKGDYTEAYLLRGKTLLTMGDTDGAYADAASAVNADPENEDCLMLKARVERAKGNSEEAIETYGKAIEANPFNADAYRERGAIRYEQGYAEEAKDDLKRAMELQPEKMAGISGDFTAEGIESKTRQAYSNLNPLGI